MAGKGDEFVAGDAQLRPELPKELLDQRKVEGVVARRHRRVGGEERVGAHSFDCLGEGEPLALHVFAYTLQAQEGAVAFVHVPHGGIVAQRSHGARAANPQYKFLTDAHFAVAAIEACAQVAVGRCIALHVGVHEVDGDAPYLDAPDLGVDRSPGQVDADKDLFALRIKCGRCGDFGKGNLFVFGLLHTIFVNALGEIALRVEKADADEGQPQVAG